MEQIEIKEGEQMEGIREAYIQSLKRTAAGLPPLNLAGEPITEATPTEEEKIQAAEAITRYNTCEKNR